MTVFAQNAVGFFIQVFPCALMVFLPFPETAYRFRRKQVFAGITVLSLSLSVLFSVVMCRAARWNTVFSANLFMLTAILLMLAAGNWLVREALIKKTLVVCTTLFYGASQYWLANVLEGVLPDLIPLSREFEAGAVYSPCGLVMYVVTAAFLLPLMISFVIRPLREYLQEVETEKTQQEFMILVVSTGLFLVLMMASDIRYYYVETRLYLQELPLFLLVLLDQILIYWLVFRESVRRKRDSEHQRAMEIQQLQYEKIVDDMENTRRMRHDLHHHYNALNDMLQDGRLEEMKGYLSQMLDATTKRMNEVYCGNMLVNGLLQYYAGLARDEGIRCDIQAACGEVTVDPADLTVLFGNAMENAINACRKCAADRWIQVHVGTVQGSLAIEISNACSDVCIDRRARTEDGFLPAEAFLSSRTGGGYGLRSIARTAQKYGGSAKFRYNVEKETFTARIRLNMPAR